jgi:hypothetical protein
MANLRQLLESLLGQDNAELFIVIIQDGLFIVLVAGVLQGGSFILALLIGLNHFFGIVHEGLVFASVLTLVCRALKRLTDWVRRG